MVKDGRIKPIPSIKPLRFIQCLRIRESVLAILVLCLTPVPPRVQSVLRFVIGVLTVTSRILMSRGYYGPPLREELL